jgi:putative peptide zinc metalloprotease protein
MTTTSAAPGGRGDAAASPGTLSTDVPVRATGVELIGEMPGSGYREPPALVRRSDGQMLQLTPLLYAVLEAVDGRRDVQEIADVVSASYGRAVTAANVAMLVDDKLRPLGALRTADGSEPETKKSRPLLGLQLRYRVTDPEKTRRLTAPFAVLFNPVVVTAVLAAFLAITWWVFFDKGLASAAHEAFHKPGLLLLIFVVTVLSAGFHEFGHAAAARRGGATPGVMGMGLYLFWPAFYTDVTDAYRLGRGGRLRTDLGGLYFNAIVAVGVVGIWWLTGYDALLLVVATQILQMVRQLLPMIRFDGYHVLADLTGVPDLYSRIKPVLLGALPWRWRDSEASALKPWARVVVTLWVVVVVPIFLSSMALMVLTLPRLLATAWVSLGEQADLVGEEWASGRVVAVAEHVLSIVALAVPVLGVAYLVVRLVRQAARSTWRGTADRPVRRAVALLVAGAILAGLAWAWWPRPDVYRPIAAYEQGTLGALLPRVAPNTGVQGLQVGAERTVVTAWPNGADRPTRDHPSLAVVMVPAGPGPSQPTAEPSPTAPTGTPSAASTSVPSATTQPSAPATSDVGPTEGPSASGAGQPGVGVFPFDLPLPPGDGDTQALAVNTTDNTVTYDVAFALVWVDDDTVTNTNEAFAAASCTNCAAVAVSFQVVFIMGDAHVIVPENLATAVNYNCLQCLTYALASQLVITLGGPLSDESMAALESVWTQLATFAADITSVPLDELQDTLEGFRDQITQIILADPSATPLRDDPAGTSPDGGQPSGGTSTSGVSPSGSASASADPSDSASATHAPTSDAPTEPAEPSSEGTSESTTPSASSTSSPTPTESPSGTPTDATTGADTPSGPDSSLPSSP